MTDVPDKRPLLEVENIVSKFGLFSNIPSLLAFRLPNVQQLILFLNSFYL